MNKELDKAFIPTCISCIGLYKMLLGILVILFFQACAHLTKSQSAENKDLFIGAFTDDYDIHYTIKKKEWIQYPNIKYHILEWNLKDQYILAQNDSKNPEAGNKYTRIDFMKFSNMAPFEWGFCLSVYDADSQEAALEMITKTDRSTPKTGCNGFPFSRMKRKIPPAN